MANGSNFSLGYVERPQVAQMAPGEPPLALFVSAGPKYMGGPTFTWAQRFCDEAALSKGNCGFMGGVAWNGPQPKPPPPPPAPRPPAPPPVPSHPQVGDVIAALCTSDRTQTWAANASTKFTHFIWEGAGDSSPSSQQCLSFAQNRTAAHGHGQTLVVASCANPDSQWSLTNGSTLKSSKAVPCLHWKGQCQCAKPTVGDTVHGLELWDCEDRSALKAWVFSGGQLRVNGTHCASVVDGSDAK